MVQPVFINRISACLPHDAVDNDSMEARLGMVGPRPSRARKLVLRSNGIQQRHYVIDPPPASEHDQRPGQRRRHSRSGRRRL